MRTAACSPHPSLTATVNVNVKDVVDRDVIVKDLSSLLDDSFTIMT
jgi:hypothetical protein